MDRLGTIEGDSWFNKDLHLLTLCTYAPSEHVHRGTHINESEIQHFRHASKMQRRRVVKGLTL